MSENEAAMAESQLSPIESYVRECYVNEYFLDKIDLINREIFFSRDVDSDSIDTLLGHLLKLQEIDPTSPVTVVINSPGGEAHACLKYYDEIRRLQIPVNSLVSGCSMSAATIMSCGTTGHRMITKHSAMMIHEVLSWEAGEYSKLKKRLKYTDTIQNNIIKIYMEHSKNKDVAFWENLMRDETYFNAEEALQHGLVDQIV